MSSPSENKTPAVTEPEYEWGVRYRASSGGDLKTQWGYDDDPRASGFIHENGDVQAESFYHKAVAVGKRIKNPDPEIWENI